MADTGLDRLFQSRSFLSDLPRMAKLPPAALVGIREVFQKSSKSSDEPYTASDVTNVAVRTNSDVGVLGQTFALSAFLGALIQGSRVDIITLEQHILSALQGKVEDLQPFLGHIRALADVSDDLAAVRDRRIALIGGGKTINETYVTCDLRVRTRGDLPERLEELAQYEPQIAELFPVVTVRVSFAQEDDGDDTVFQLTPRELRKFVVQLQAAEKQVEAATASVTLKKLSQR
jgi:hypothetical protein